MDRNLLLLLGWTYDEMKRFDDSTPLFQRAREIDPNSVQVIAAHAAHLEALGKRDEAREEYQRAADRGSVAGYLALKRMETERNNPRTGAESDAPKLGR
jgi:tetratricopeptide (TPR) repeat protein